MKINYLSNGTLKDNENLKQGFYKITKGFWLCFVAEK